MEETWLWLKYLILGIVQGVTEPIPVSSSGHVIIAQRLLGTEQTGLTFEILTNTASLLAIMFIFRHDIWRLISNTWNYLRTRRAEYKSDFMFAVYVVVGTIPTVIIGLLLKDWIEAVFSSIKTVGIALFVTGIALWLIRNLRGRKQDGDLTMKDALFVGFAQAVALIPGISRSGATIVAAMGTGMKQDTALRYSFMLYIPASLGAIVLSLSDVMEASGETGMGLPYTLAFIATLITTYFSMKWLMGIMAKGNLKYFAYYCFVAGIVLLIVL